MGRKKIANIRTENHEKQYEIAGEGLCGDVLHPARTRAAQIWNMISRILTQWDPGSKPQPPNTDTGNGHKNVRRRPGIGRKSDKRQRILLKFSTSSKT